MNALARLESLLLATHIDGVLAAPAAIAPLAEERRKATGARDLVAYAELAASDPAELMRLRGMVTVPETWYFRYAASFDFLRERLLARRPRAFRALCVACATGAEPYSVAATALSCGIPSVQVIGVDPSEDAIARARGADLGRLAGRGGLPAWATPWLVRGDAGDVAVSAEARGAVEFRLGAAPAALEGFPAGSFDAVFCRNLAIYLSPAGRAEIGSRLGGLAAGDGVIFLGHAERAAHFGLADGWEPPAGAEPGTFALVRRAAMPPGTASAPPRRDHATAAAPGNGPAARPAAGRDRAAASPSATARRPAPPATAPTSTGGTHDGNAALAMVRSLADRGEIAPALAAAGELLEAGDRSVGLLVLLGSLHMAAGEHEAAEAALRQAAYLDPRNADALVQLGVLAERRGDAGLAERYRARASEASR